MLLFFFLNLGGCFLGGSLFFWMFISEVCLILGGYILLISVLVLLLRLYILNFVFFNFVVV